MPKPAPDPDRIALILADAADIGDQAACRKHRISRRTLVNYRRRRDNCADVSQKCAEVKAELVEAWLDRAKSTRRKLLERVEALAEKSDNLHDVTGAYKIVNDGILAEQVVSEGDPREDDGGRAGPSFGMAREGRPVAQTQRAADKLSH